MNDVKINITLDPLKDGLVMQDHGKKVLLERDLHYPIIGTDGQMRLLKPRESVDIQEICHVQDILENHMAVLRAGELTFSALEID